MQVDYKYTKKELALLYEILDEFGSDKKPLLKDKIKTLLRYNRISVASKKRYHDENCNT